MNTLKIAGEEFTYVIFDKSASVSYKGKTVCFSKDDIRFVRLQVVVDEGRNPDFLNGIEAMNNLIQMFDIELK